MTKKSIAVLLLADFIIFYFFLVFKNNFKVSFLILFNVFKLIPTYMGIMFLEKKRIIIDLTLFVYL